MRLPRPAALRVAVATTALLLLVSGCAADTEVERSAGKPPPVMLSATPVAPVATPTSSPSVTLFAPANDLGEREFARGKAVLSADGTPVAYEVASGDVWDIVWQRFQVPDLWALNCLRRPTGQLYEGDIVNLDPATIASVGSENGQTTVPQDQADRCRARDGFPEQR